jgi:HCO3- transporter family
MANVKSVTGIPVTTVAARIEIGGTKLELSASLSSTSNSDTITSFSIDDGGVEDREKEGEVEGDCESEGDGSAEPVGAPVAAVVTAPVGVTSEIFSDVIETRLTGFVIHGAILSSLFLLPFLGNIPVPVISGIFLYLGKKMMKGNLFLERLGNIIIEKRLLPATNIFNTLPAPTVLKYLTVQSLMLLLIWVMKQNKNFSLFFPSCIAFLMIVRSVVMPNFFSAAELNLLDPEM